MPYNIPVLRVSMIKESTVKSEVKAVSNPDEVYELMKIAFEGREREVMFVILLNTKNQLVGMNMAAMGTLNSCTVHPREIFKPAIITGAAAIILSHNHPSGDPSPSPQDIELTKRIQQAGELLGISLLDHVIAGDEKFVSLKSNGLF